MLTEKRFAFVASKDAGGRADGADATGAERRRVAQTIFRRQVVEQAEDVTGVEGVAAAGAVDVFDRKRPGPQTNAIVHQHRPFAAAGNDDGSRAKTAKLFGVSEYVA